MEQLDCSLWSIKCADENSKKKVYLYRKRKKRKRLVNLLFTKSLNGSRRHGNSWDILSAMLDRKYHQKHSNRVISSEWSQHKTHLDLHWNIWMQHHFPTMDCSRWCRQSQISPTTGFGDEMKLKLWLLPFSLIRIQCWRVLCFQFHSLPPLSTFWCYTLTN